MPARALWSRLTGPPFRAAWVIVLIVSAAAGLFAGSYTYAMANPTPRHIPAAITGAVPSRIRHEEFVAGMEKALGASLNLRHYPSYAAARDAVEDQRVFAILQEHGRHPELDVSSASGASVAELLAQAAPAVGAKLGVRPVVRDINPLQRSDPRGLAIFYVSLASVVVGFVGAAQLGAQAKELTPGQRTAFVVLYSLLGGFCIFGVTDWAIGALRLPFPESWLILAGTMFTSGMVFIMFATLIGRWALLPTWFLMVLLGNPSSGGAVSWPLLPSLLGTVGRWLPPGAAVNAQHTAVYFGGRQHAFPFLVLAVWATVACGVFWFRRHRLAPTPSPAPPPAPHASG